MTDTSSMGQPMPSEFKVVSAGIGGQGVVFATRILATAALAGGRPVVACETHGMSQRGGSVLSHLRLGGGEAPLLRQGTADVLLAFDLAEGLRALPYLRPGGVAFADNDGSYPTELEAPLSSRRLRIHCLPARRIAEDGGSKAAANVVIIGAASAHPDWLIPMDALRAAVAKLSGRSTDQNLRALDAGYQAFASSQAQLTRPEVA